MFGIVDAASVDVGAEREAPHFPSVRPAAAHRPRPRCCQPTNSPTAALSSDSPFFASAKNMPVFGLV